MSRESLQSILQSLSETVPPEDGFVASRIDPESQVRIGRGSSSIALLVPTEQRSAAEPDLRLENLSVTHFAECSVIDGEARIKGCFGIIECTSPDPGIRNTFIEILDWLLPSDGEVTTTDAKNLFHRVIRLLSEPDAPARTSTLGLWGELFVMRTSTNAVAWSGAWHITPRDRWDFSFGKTRVEVKTSSSGRRHHFSLDQLVNAEGTETFVVSLITNSSSSGPSIRELLEELALQVDKETRARLIENAVASLGSSWSVGSQSRFDNFLAIDSMRVYSSLSVPQVSAPPPEVSEVRFVSDLSDVESLGAASILATIGAAQSGAEGSSPR